MKLKFLGFFFFFKKLKLETLVSIWDLSSELLRSAPPQLCAPWASPALGQKLTHLLHDLWREYPRSKCSPENIRKLLIQTADPHFLKVPVRIDDGLAIFLGFSFACVK